MTMQTGGCQCGAVRYSVEMEITEGLTCNCSRCQRLGSVLTFVPSSAFTLDKGEDALTEYLFNTHTIRHQFCATCGIEPFAYGEKDGAQMVAINLNTVDGIDPRAVPTQHVDGRSR